MKKIFYIFIIGISITTSLYFFFQKYPVENKLNEKVAAHENTVLTTINDSNTEAKTPSSDRPIKRVIMITLDTLNPDHLGFMGYKRNTSPFLDKIASESIVFKNGFTTYPMTGPAHASIFTGLYPDQHQVLNNASPLSDNKNTMAEYFKKMGYKTAAFISVLHLHTANLQQGFDVFDFSYSEEKLKTDYDITISPRRSAEDTVSATIDWLNTLSNNDDFFLWIHIFDQHAPYKKSLEYNFTEQDELKSNNDLTSYWTSQGVESDLYKDPADKNMFKAINKYDATIQYTDNELQKFYEYFEKNNLNKDALWVITNDHGESLGSHYYYGHDMRVYNEQLKTPIILHNPEHKNKTIYTDTVENVDIFPTLVDLTGGTHNFSVWPHGLSLVPIIAGSDGEKEYAFASRYQPQGELRLVRKTHMVDFLREDTFIKVAPFKQYSLQNKEYKYIHKVPADHEQLEYIDAFYDLRNDPLEQNNLINKHLDEGSKFKDELLNYINILQTSSAESQTTQTPNSELEKSLRALGY